MTPPQILLNNLLYDSSQLAIPTDNVDQSYMMRPRQFKIRFIKLFMIIFGPISSVFDFATFFISTAVFHFSGASFQTGWFLESILTQTLVVYIIRTKKIPFLQSSPSRALLITTLSAVALSWIAVYLPVHALFGFVPLPIWPVLSIIGLTVLYLIIIEFAKRWFYKKIVLDD